MSVKIVCPSCGFSKELPDEKVPKGAVRVTCPGCKQPFVFQNRPEKVRIACPHCDFTKDVPKSSLPAARVRINCPKCKQAFLHPPDVTKPPEPAVPPPELDAGEERPSITEPAPLKEEPVKTEQPGVGATAGERRVRPEAPRTAPKAEPGDIGGLFSRAWDKYKRRFWPLLALYLLTAVFFLVPLGVFGGAAFLAATMGGTPGLAGAVLLGFAGVVAGTIGMTWAFAGMLHALNDDGLGVKDALREGRDKIWGLAWVMALAGFIILGGLLFFIIPGIIFSIWLFAALYVFTAEGERGMAALLKSREYVRGNFWGTLGRLFLVWLLSAVLGAIPVIGPILSLIFAPFTVIFTFLVYEDLKERKGDFDFSPVRKDRVNLLAGGLMGYLFIPLVAAAFMFSFSMKHNIPIGSMLRSIFEKVPSFGSLNLVSGKEKELRAVYLEYRKAMEAGDIPALKKIINSKKAGELDGPNAQMMLQLAQGMTPRNITFVGAAINDNSATLNVQGEADRGIVKGEVKFIKEGGDWKIDNEEWSMNVQPWPVTLKWGDSAPGLGPVDASLLTPADGFGFGPDASFIRAGAGDPQKLLTLTGHEGEVTQVEFLPDGRLISMSYGDYTVRMWDVSTGAELANVKLENRPQDMCLTPDGSTLILTDAYQNLVFLPVSFNTFGQPEVLSAGLGSSPHIAISPNGRLIATASFDKNVTVWSIGDRRMLAKIQTPEPMRDIAFHPSGQILAAGSNTNKFTLWDLKEGKGKSYTVSKVDKGSDIGSIDFSPDGRRIATGHMDSSITVWDAQEQKELQNFFVSQASTWGVRFSPDGKVFASAQQDNAAYIWETDTAARKAKLAGHTAGVRCASFSHDGRILATGSEDKTIIIWGYELPQPGAAMAMPGLSSMASPALDDAGGTKTFEIDAGK